MSQQLRVKSKAQLPYSYSVPDAFGNVLVKWSPKNGTEHLAFEQFVDPSGNTWTADAFQLPLVASEEHVGQGGGTTVLSTASFMRPANTTTYAAGELVTDGSSTPLLFPSVVRKAGGSGVLLNAELIDLAYTVALLGSFELYLFDAIPTLVADNAAVAMLNQDVSRIIHVVPFSTTPYATNAGAGAAGNCVYTADPINRAFVCQDGLTNIWGALVVRNAYVPVSLEEFVVRLTVVQD